MPPVRGLPVAPLTGLLDLRSNVDQLAPGAVRMRQNLQATGEKKLSRGHGWSKLLSNGTYNNQDFHDQLLTFQSASIRKPVTLLFPTESEQGPRYLIAATQSQIALLDESGGDWRVLGHGYGGVESASAAAPRFKAAQLDQFVAFTNDFDAPMYHVLENGEDTGLNTFADLATIGVTRAGVVWSFRGCLFLADIEMDGQRFSNMILWSDYQKPTSFDPAVLSSITGQKFLDPGERILAGLPFGNSFLIYTNQNIWEMVLVGGEMSFDFAVRYPGKDNKSVGLLKYRNTLVSIGDEHAYLAEDGLYTFSPYYVKPTRVEWAHYSTPAIMDEIDTSNCSVHVAHYHDYELLISVARVGAAHACPDITLRFHTQFRSADIIDAGFTAFANYQSFGAPTVRDFIVENGICDLAGLAAQGYPMGDQGIPKPPLVQTVETAPTRFYTTFTRTESNGATTVTVEDWEQSSASAGSLCSILGNLTLDDLCRTCAKETILVAANSADWCLKQLDESLAREMCTNPTGTGTTTTDGYSSSAGTYQLNGYDSILRFSPLFLQQAGDPYVQLDQVKLDFEPVHEDSPASVGLRVGVSAQPTDPNGNEMLWFQHSTKVLQLATGKTPAQHAAAGTIPANCARWKIYRIGRLLYVEIKISGTGGEASLTRMTMEASPHESPNA